MLETKELPRTVELAAVTVSPETSIREAMLILDAAGSGALAVCNDRGTLVGLISDGDIRRALLRSHPLEDACISIACSSPIVITEPIQPASALEKMDEYDVDQLPVVDEEGTLIDFLLRKHLGGDHHLTFQAQERIRRVCTSPETCISDAIAQLNDAGTGALVLINRHGKLHGLITDGDIRRAVIQRRPTSDACGTVATLNPIRAQYPVSAAEALQLMNQHDIHHLPVTDVEGRVVEFLLRKDLHPASQHDLQAVVMAGGYGKRLLPLTEKVPKPMLPIGEKPLLELILRQLRRAGIQDINLTTHYLPDCITGHFGNGQEFGVRLNYSREEHPLGTAGGLRLMPRPGGPFVVINGDILTGVPFQEMLHYHRSHRAMMTVGVRKYDIQVPFGVVDCSDVRITKIEEKPSHSYFVNAGTYLLDPAAWNRIPENTRFDMTDLIRVLLESGETVVGFPITEYWIDVGRHEDYLRAQELVSKGEI